MWHQKSQLKSFIIHQNLRSALLKSSFLAHVLSPISNKPPPRDSKLEHLNQKRIHKSASDSEKIILKM